MLGTACFVHDEETNQRNLISIIWGFNMSVLKIIRLVVLAIAAIGAFVAIPEAALILAVLGLVMGVMGDMADNSNRTYMMVFAVTLALSPVQLAHCR